MTRGGAPGAHIESFFHSLKADLNHGRLFSSIGELRGQLRWYVRYYNYQRMHSALGISRLLTVNDEPRRTHQPY